VDDIKSILLAEDVEDDARIIQVTLKQAGVINPVYVVHDGLEAITYLSGTGEYADRARFPQPGVLLLDLTMPKRNGFEVLEWCKEQSYLRNMLTIVLSGNREIGSIKKAYSLGAHSFLLKPCHVQDVANLTQTFKGYWAVEPFH
jgi:CheY-like chemotaxis protein